MDVGFVILCPDHEIKGALNSLGSIKANSYDRQSICVVGDNTTIAELSEFNNNFPTFVGEKTITSLVNVGIKKCQHDWAFLIFSGSRITPYIEKKFSTWVKKPTDILFPVVNRKCNFVDGSFNGVLINTKFFAEVGDFPNYVMEKEGINDFELSKLLWSIEAIAKGVNFKAIIGLNVI